VWLRAIERISVIVFDMIASGHGEVSDQAAPSRQRNRSRNGNEIEQGERRRIGVSYSPVD